MLSQITWKSVGCNIIPFRGQTRRMWHQFIQCDERDVAESSTHCQAVSYVLVGLGPCNMKHSQKCVVTWVKIGYPNFNTQERPTVDSVRTFKFRPIDCIICKSKETSLVSSRHGRSGLCTLPKQSTRIEHSGMIPPITPLQPKKAAVTCNASLRSRKDLHTQQVSPKMRPQIRSSLKRVDFGILELPWVTAKKKVHAKHVLFLLLWFVSCHNLLCDRSKQRLA